MAIALVPLGWTVLFATAGALTPGRDELHRRRRRSAGACRGGVRGAHHVRDRGEAAADAARRAASPLRLGELSVAAAAAAASGQSTMPGAERVRAAHARLRSAAFEGVPSLGRSAGRAAGALGAPAGGPLGAARGAWPARRVAAASCPARRRARSEAPLGGAAAAGRGAAQTRPARRPRAPAQRGRDHRQRARATPAPRWRRARPQGRASAARAARPRAARHAAARGTGRARATGKTRGERSAGRQRRVVPVRARQPGAARPAPARPAACAQGAAEAAERPSSRSEAPAPKAAPAHADGTHPGRKVTTTHAATRRPAAPAPRQAAIAPPGQRSKPPELLRPPPPKEPARRAPAKRRPRHGAGRDPPHLPLAGSGAEAGRLHDRQWAVLIAGASAVLGLVYLAHLPTKPAITLCVFVDRAAGRADLCLGERRAATRRAVARYVALALGPHALPASAARIRAARAAWCPRVHRRSGRRSLAADGHLTTRARGAAVRGALGLMSTQRDAPPTCSGSPRSARTGCSCARTATYVRYLEVGVGQPARAGSGRGRAGLRRVRSARRAAAGPSVPSALRAGHSA